MKELYRLRIRIERARRMMYKASDDNLLITAQLLDKLLNEYEQEKRKVGLYYCSQS